jgi:hypothetical protein
MRSFGPADKLEQVDEPFGLIFARCAFALLLAMGVMFTWAAYRIWLDPSSRQYCALLAGFAVLGILSAIHMARSLIVGRPQSSPGPWLAFPILMLFGEAAWYSWGQSKLGSLVIVAFICLFVFGLVTRAAQSIQDRRIARVIRDSALPRPIPPGVPASHRPRLAGPMYLHVYLHRELPPLPSYQIQVTNAHNIVGEAPRRILYLYNFFSFESLNAKLAGGWRRFGPVYFLGSPKDISYNHAFTLKIRDTVSPLLLADQAAVDQQLDNLSELPLAPGDQNLAGFAFLTGGYLQHVLTCTDASWQYAVLRLFQIADRVIVDACGYRPERSGLNWEIGHIVDHVATEKLIVLVDSDTDQVGLGTHFRAAWASMSGDSPNNRPDAAAVTCVYIGDNAHTLDEAVTLCSEALASYKQVAVQSRQRWRGRLLAEYSGVPMDDRLFGVWAHAGPRAAVYPAGPST